jgi:hypothetical protein
LVVSAGTDHCFESFSSDLAVWVIFYGPAAGYLSQATAAAPNTPP